MTCVVAVPNRDGLVVAADRLVTDDDGRQIEESTKLFALKRGVFVVTGKAGIGTTAEGELFSAEEITRRELVGKALDAIDWRSFRKALGEPLKRALELIPPHARPPVSTPRASLIQVLTYFVDRRGAMRLAVVSVGLEKAEPVLLNLRYDDASPENFEYARPLVAASVEVWNEIQSGTDSNFADLRANPVFARFISAPRMEEVTGDEAAAFSRELIRATAQRKHLLGGKGDVGATANVMLLGRDGELRSLDEGESDAWAPTPSLMRPDKRERNARKRARRSRR